MQELNISALYKRHSGLTRALSDAYFEAACVCLNRHHTSPVELSILRNGGSTNRSAQFQEPSAKLLNAWANTIDTTEAGAYCVSLAAVELEEGLVAVKRAETLTGADWYVAEIGAEPEDLENCFRLEISGTDLGNSNAIQTRLLQKVGQTMKGASNLPALAAVVGFRDRVVAIQRVDEEP